MMRRRRPLSAAAKQHIANIKAFEVDVADLEKSLRVVKEKLNEERELLGRALLRKIKIGDRMRREHGSDGEYVVERAVGLLQHRGPPFVALYGHRVRKDGKPTTGGEQWIGFLSKAPDL